MLSFFVNLFCVFACLLLVMIKFCPINMAVHVGKTLTDCSCSRIALPFIRLLLNSLLMLFQLLATWQHTISTIPG